MPETFFSGSGSLFSVVEFKELGAGDFYLILYKQKVFTVENIFEFTLERD